MKLPTLWTAVLSLMNEIKSMCCIIFDILLYITMGLSNGPNNRKVDAVLFIVYQDTVHVLKKRPLKIHFLKIKALFAGLYLGIH